MRKRDTVTIEDVAKAAGVSPASVSNAFNQRLTRMSEATRQRILEAAARLRYTPNAAAVSLRSRKTNTIGLLVTNILNPFYSAVVRGIQDAARGAGYSVILGNTDDDPRQESEMLGILAGRRVDGMLVVTTGGNHATLKRLGEGGSVIVLLDRGDPALPFDTVVVDNQRAARDAVAHLTALGHRRIGLLNGTATGVPTRAGRMKGYEAALREVRIKPRPEYERLLPTDPENGYRAMLEMLDLDQPPTALFIANTLLATGAFRALHERRVRIPRDLSVVMFDDPEWAALMTPPVTAVAQPIGAIAERAFGLLIERMRGANGPPRTEVLPAHLRVRASASAPAT